MNTYASSCSGAGRRPTIARKLTQVDGVTLSYRVQPESACCVTGNKNIRIPLGGGDDEGIQAQQAVPGAGVSRLLCELWCDGGRSGHPGRRAERRQRSEEHTSELQSLMRISYAVFCLK